MKTVAFTVSDVDRGKSREQCCLAMERANHG